MLKRTLLLLGAFAMLAPGATIPRPAGEFVIQGPNGQALLSQFRGKVILLEFMHTTCSHCQQSVAVVNQLQRDFGPRGFQAVGAAFNDGASQLLPDFLARFRPIYPVGVTPRDTVLEYLQLPSNTPIFVPIFVFIDKKGMIREQHFGNGDKFLDNPDANSRASIEALLKEGAPPAKKISKAR